MSKTPFGLSTLMESMRYSETKEREATDLLQVVIGESVVSDDIKNQIIASDSIGGIEDDYVDENDPELNRILDLIPEDDEDELLDEIDDVLESVIID